MSPTFPLLATFLAVRPHAYDPSLFGRNRGSDFTYLHMLQSLLEEKRMLLRGRSVWVMLMLLALLVPGSVCRVDAQGIVVETVVPGSVAEKAGIQVGDRLLTYNGKPLCSPPTLRALIANTFDKEQVSLVFQQGQQQRTAIIPVGTLGILIRPVLSAEVLTLYQEGKAAGDARQVGQQAARWTEAVKRAQETGDSIGSAWLQTRIGDLETSQDHGPEARAAYERAWKLLEGSKEAAIQISVLSSLGDVCQSLNDLAGAKSYYEQEQVLAEAAGYAAWSASSLNDLGGVAYYRGDLKAAQDYYERSLAIREKLAPGSLGVAASLNNLGVIADERGDLKTAQDNHRRALTIREKLSPGSLDVAESLNNLGMVASKRGDLKAAQDYDERALAIQEKLSPGSLAMATSLNNLGMVASKRGDLKAAQDYDERALAIQEKLSPGSLAMAISLDHLGSVAQDRGDLKAAQDYYERSLAIREKLAPGSRDVAASLNNLGAVASARGDLKATLDYFERALVIQEKLSPGSLEIAASLNNLGYSRLGQNRPTEALPLFTRAVAIVESQRAKVNSSEGRTLLASKHTHVYAGLLACQLALHDYPAAFATLERSRARGLVELLTERHLDFRKDAPADLLQQQDDLSAQKAAAYTHMAKLDPDRDTKQIAVLRAEIENVNTRQRELEAQIRQASPKLAALQYPQPLDLKGAQSALDPGMLLLAYFVDEHANEAYLFAVTGQPHPTLAFYRISIPADKLLKQVEAFRAALAHRGNFLASGQALYHLLIQPAQHLITQAQRLLICPDGPLHTLPFAALVAQDTFTGTPQGAPVIVGHTSQRGGKQRSRGQRGTEIVNGMQRLNPNRLSHLRYLADLKPLSFTLSATVFADLKKRRISTPPDRSSLSLLAYGDPDYTSGKDSAEHNLSRLPGTRAEVLALGRLYGQQARIRLGPQASEAALKKEIAGAHYLHLACHGLLDQQDALASGLALTPGGGEDGLLQAWEIFEQVRLNADLVVLSACETGLGETTKTEGVTGLTRALQYAGAQSVLVSLWSVADESTPPLMTTFYQQLRAGKSKDVALQGAMQALRQKPAYRHPYYWAPFTLIGDWR